MVTTAPPTTEDLQRQIADLSTKLGVSTLQITGDIAVLRDDVGLLSAETQNAAAASGAKLDTILAGVISLQTSVTSVASDVTSLRADVNGLQTSSAGTAIQLPATQAGKSSLSIPDRTRIFASLQPYRRNGAPDVTQ